MSNYLKVSIPVQDDMTEAKFEMVIQETENHNFVTLSIAGGYDYTVAINDLYVATHPFMSKRGEERELEPLTYLTSKPSHQKAMVGIGN